MKKRTLTVFSILLVTAHSLALTGCGTTAKMTNRIVDENNNPLKNAETWVSWTVLKTSNPFDGTRDVNKKSTTDRDGEHTFDNFDGPKVWIGARMPGYYESHRYYIFPKLDGYYYQPWNPTVTLRLRKIENPIPMYAKNFMKFSIPATEVGYDLIKGDFTPPHGKGEIADCMISFTEEFEGEFTEQGFDKRDIFSITFLGDFNGIEPISEADIIEESIFQWPREAYPLDYSTHAMTQQKLYTKRSDPAPDSLLFFTREQNRHPNVNHLFFRIRAEKNPDGSFKSALYGKLIVPKFYNDAAPKAETTRILQNFTYYVNPTRNDRNMEFDPNENLMYKDYKLKLPNGNSYIINPAAYKNGETGVGAP